MTQITIRQTGDLTASPNAEISFAGEPGFPITVENPFREAEEARLAWYFEKWLTFPFTDGVKAQAAAASVRRYGEMLFAQTLHGDDRIYSRYRQAVARGVETIFLQIVGDPEFHKLHWEALWDPDRPQPLTLDTAMIRSTVQPVVHSVTVQPSPTINLLLVTARPHGGRDVGYRTIQRPLLEMLRATQLPVRVDLVRPGSWRALVEHLRAARRQHGVGHYQIIHFDLHGALLNRRQLAEVKGVEPHSYKVRLQDRFARPDLTLPTAGATEVAGERTTAWLFFEDEAGDDLDAASAEEVAGLLLDHQIPIAILNACQSGQETGDPETGLGSRLLAAGVQTVVAMGYSVTVSAATHLMATLYRQLFQPPHDLLAALCAGRTALHHEKARKAAYNQTIKLEDWLLPVVYQPSSQTPRHLPLREMSFDETIAFYSRLTERYTPPEPEYGFVGRDVDILQIEKRLLSTSEGKARNLLLIQGMGGAGKSTLLRHLAGWWQTTGLVDEIFYFGYDERAYTLPQLLDAIARRLLNRTISEGAVVAREFAAFQAMQPRVQATLLAQKLRAERHLLLLDNLESVTGDPLAIPNTLPPAEQAAIRGWLADLLGGRTLVLLGSRGSAGWLQGGVNPPLRAVDCYALPGLDAEAAANLAERILQRQVSDPAKRQRYAADPVSTRLLKLLDGSPLALEVVLSNLARQTPEEILAALEVGDVALDSATPPQPSRAPGAPGGGIGYVAQGETVPPPNWGRLGGGDKTRSILQCIAYAHSNLDAEAQRLLLCLFPFTGVVDVDPTHFSNYVKNLISQSLELPFARFPEVLRAAQEWGLLARHKLFNFLHIQPVLPYFLRMRITLESVEVKQMIETAFRLHYTDMAEALHDLFKAKDVRQHQTAYLVTEVEYENLAAALQLSLVEHQHFFDLYAVLGHYLDSVQDHHRGINLGKNILAQMNHYPPKIRYGVAGSSFLQVLVDLGERQIALQLYSDAEATYQVASHLIQQITNIDVQTKASWEGMLYNHFGIVAQEQRQWALAEAYYQQGLDLSVRLNDRYQQAIFYHQLGIVAQEQWQWTQAEVYYQQALALFTEFNDYYHQAHTYHQLGMMAQEQRQWTQAEAYYQHSLDIYIDFNDYHHQNSTYHQLGIVAQEQRQWAKAETYYRQALTIDIEYDKHYSQASTYHQLGRLAQEQRQWTQAKLYYQKALAIKLEYDDQYSQAPTLLALGIVLEEQREFRQAEEYYQRALKLYIQFNDKREQARVYHQLGNVAYEQRQWDHAEQYYQQALAINLEHNDYYSLAGNYYQLGLVAAEGEQWVQAERYYQQVLAIRTEHDERYSQADTYHQLGNVAYAIRHYEQAEHYYQQAITIYTEFNNKHGQASLLHSLGRRAQVHQQWKQAEEYYQQALALFIEYNDCYNQARTYGQLGLLMQDQERWGEAVRALAQALAIFAEFNDQYDVKIAINALRNLYQAHPDETVLQEIATVLGETVEAVRGWITTAD